MSMSLRWTWVITALIAIAAIGSLRLLTPLTGDTAMFLTAARVLGNGGTLYLDFWDFKQPGIYWFFLGAGKLFGYTQHGVRAFELIYMMAFAIVMIASLPRLYERKWLAALAPVLAIGTYYAASTEWHLTQLEMLVAFPIYFAAWLLYVTCQQPDASTGTPGVKSHPKVGLLVMAGIAAGIALVFKLALAPIFVAFVLLAALHRAGGFQLRPLFREILAVGIPMAIGSLVVLAIVSAVYVARNAFGELAWVTFVFPKLALNEVGVAPLERLYDGLDWFVTATLPLLVLSIFALPRLWLRREPLFTKLMAAWVIVGFGIILIQRFSWWEYHFLLLFVPIALLATRGMDRLLLGWERWRQIPRQRMKPAAIFVCVIALSMIAYKASSTIGDLFYAFGNNHLSVEDYRRMVSPEYATASAVVTTMEESAAEPDAGKDAKTDPIYVFGNPLVYMLSHREQSFPINGWGWEYNPQEIWDHLPRDLMKSKPAFIYVEDDYRDLLQERSPAMEAYLEQNFEVIDSDEDGTLYRRKANEGS